nr:phosphatase [Maliibacterium massiliense]
MARGKKGKCAAVIDIGSGVLKMRICQMSKGRIETLDRLEYPLHLGHEVFYNGKISFESLRELTGALRNYAQVMREYDVDECRVVATSALREASNRAFVVDQLQIQNGLSVQILEEEQEKTLIYCEVLHKMDQLQLPPDACALISHIGTGSIGMALYDGAQMQYAQNIAIGSLKLHDILASVQRDTDAFHLVVEEYLNTIVSNIPLPTDGRKIAQLVLTGSEIERIAKLCGAELQDGQYRIEAKKVTALYSEMCTVTPEQISIRFDIPESDAEILYCALVIYARLIKLSHCASVVAPRVELWDALMRRILIPQSAGQYEAHVTESALACARNLALRYNCNMAHAEVIQGYACKLFDKTRAIHGLGSRERRLLALAAVLHDCGRFINSKRHAASTFNLINDSSIYGLTDEEITVVAYTASYGESLLRQTGRGDLAPLGKNKRLLVMKLAALFRLANTLDKSRKQKLGEIKIRLADQALTITGRSAHPMCFEQWAFAREAVFFQEVFGVHPRLVIKSTMLDA